MSAGGLLQGLKVLDFTRVFSGPFCTLLFSDMGADVVKVEHPEQGDDSRTFGPFIGGTSGYFQTLNRGKRSLAIDYRSEQGQAALRRLASTDIDVVIENFRPGQMEKFGLDYATLKRLNPRLIYASISGFGRSGSGVDATASATTGRGCYDIIAQAESGLMSLTGLPELPIKTGPAIADAISGLTAATGLLAALWSRERTGRGAQLDIAMVDSVFACLEATLAARDVAKTTPIRRANRDQAIAPFDSFLVSGRWIVLAAGNDALWHKLAGLIDPILQKDERFASNERRVANYDSLRPILQGWCASHSADALLARLHQAGIPGGCVRDIAELSEDPRLEARHMLLDLDLGEGHTLRVPGCPIRVVDSAEAPRARAPKLGEHTGEILAAYGLV